MDLQLRNLARAYEQDPSLENYAALMRALQGAGQPIFCYFCRVAEDKTTEDGELLSHDCGAYFCRDDGFNYVCGDPDCRTGFVCPGCLDKCSICKMNICPGEQHDTECVICKKEFCLRCVENCDRCGRLLCKAHWNPHVNPAMNVCLECLPLSDVWWNGQYRRNPNYCVCNPSDQPTGQKAFEEKVGLLRAGGMTDRFIARQVVDDHFRATGRELQQHIVEQLVAKVV